MAKRDSCVLLAAHMWEQKVMSHKVRCQLVLSVQEDGVLSVLSARTSMRRWRVCCMLYPKNAGEKSQHRLRRLEMKLTGDLAVS